MIDFIQIYQTLQTFTGAQILTIYQIGGFCIVPIVLGLLYQDGTLEKPWDSDIIMVMGLIVFLVLLWPIALVAVVAYFTLYSLWHFTTALASCIKWCWAYLVNWRGLLLDTPQNRHFPRLKDTGVWIGYFSDNGKDVQMVDVLGAPLSHDNESIGHIGMTVRGMYMICPCCYKGVVEFTGSGSMPFPIIDPPGLKMLLTYHMREGTCSGCSKRYQYRIYDFDQVELRLREGSKWTTPGPCRTLSEVLKEIYRNKI